MDNLAAEFHAARAQLAGPLLAQTLAPIAPPTSPHRLRDIARSCDTFSVYATVRSSMSSVRILGLSKAEQRSELAGWIDVYAAYWKACNELCQLEDGSTDEWTRVYDMWKELTNALIKGYSSAGFENWTIPCLYTVGRYLRVFAIKADESLQGRGTEPKDVSTTGQDDIMGMMGKNETLEDAARVLNRIFTLCITDRAPILDSRKWGLYYITNLLFKTYFKVCMQSMALKSFPEVGSYRPCCSMLSLRNNDSMGLELGSDGLPDTLES